MIRTLGLGLFYLTALVADETTSKEESTTVVVPPWIWAGAGFYGPYWFDDEESFNQYNSYNWDGPNRDYDGHYFDSKQEFDDWKNNHYFDQNYRHDGQAGQDRGDARNRFNKGDGPGRDGDRGARGGRSGGGGGGGRR